ncbi:hypothetical protein PMAYCL1PPCAC_04712, partial [Pristionchus mayeri]
IIDFRAMSLPDYSTLDDLELFRDEEKPAVGLPRPETQTTPLLIGEIKEESEDFDVIRIPRDNSLEQIEPLPSSNALFKFGEIKEEVVIKKEEVDDFDCIQPGEPIVDIFYPGSGTNRQIGEFGSCSDEMKQEVIDLEESGSEEKTARPRAQRKRKKAKFSYAPKGQSDYYKKKKLLQQQKQQELQNDVDELNQVYSGSSYLDDVNETTDGLMDNGEQLDDESLSTRPCYFCGEVTSVFYSTSMLTTRQRNIFIDSMMARTAIERDQRPAISEIIDRNYFCCKHFPAHYIHKNTPNPTFPTSRVSSEMQLQKHKTKWNKCDLCAVPIGPFRSSPEDPLEAREFMKSIVKMNAPQRTKFEFIRDKIGFFHSVCSKHFEDEQDFYGAEYDADVPSTSAAYSAVLQSLASPDCKDEIKEEESTPSTVNRKKKGMVKRQFYPPKGYYAKKLAEKKARAQEVPKRRMVSKPLSARPGTDRIAVEYVIDKKAAEENSTSDKKCRKCDLCDGQTANYVTSPIYSMFAKKFFDNLIWVTTHHKERIAWFLRIGKRATVCPRHLRQRATKLTKTPPHVVRQLCSGGSVPIPEELPELPKEEVPDTCPGVTSHDYDLREDKPPKRIFTL